MTMIPHPGAYPSPKDARDWLYRTISKVSINDIPVEGGIEPVPLIIHNQGDLPICTGEAGAYLQMINQYFETGQMIDLSAMFIYKMNKLIDGLPPDLEGSTVKATVETLRLKGVCREILYPTTKENYEKPLPGSRQMGRILRNAYQNRIVAYTKCLNLEDMLIALAEKKPVIFSLYLLSNFYKARRGRVPREVGGDNIGGHAMVAIRYNLEEKWVKVVQSWGRGGLTDKGYMYIPFEWFDHQVKPNFPALMEAYTVIDYIPKEEERLPEKFTINKKSPVKIELNGQTLKNFELPPFLINELGEPLINTGILEKIFNSITGTRAKVTWDPETLTLKINI
ncbi:MAG: C1 family peptidase [Clostridia bacterium]|nr:C1 family peptidase [Clostridia bacterium]